MKTFKVTKTWKVKAWDCVEAVEKTQDGKHIATKVEMIVE